ncbi:MAG: hypothetical protein UY02_C0010G0019 [Candidatus Giovannonibacteria bacterium GW2011_GWB1_47_6b]|uniref:N-acetyltransferase domain-containing protein n=1 Tax=Candidatus Giovannonibacteria bacterium GW2011_GWB1_47_6b TaxID=1618655 RepID=A0A0G1T5B8_9BACT|nr:MAG: hypothetical protein UY02_C0010G0019 [Candidatus Giovannonibacteria bacterium GW2011_GWB1_47_6b]
MNIRLAIREHASVVASLHQQEISSGFLSSLPRMFLAKFYEGIIRYPGGFCVVAEDGDRVVGFIAGITDMRAFSKFFLRHFFLAAVFLLPRMIGISIIRKFFESLRYSQRQDDLPKAELLTMAVAKDFQGRGVAKEMFTLFLGEMRARGVKVFRVLVGEKLQRAIAWYEKQGFRLAKSMSVHGKERSRIYLYTIS